MLHSWEKLPNQLRSDLDLAVHPEDRARLPLVLRRLCEEGYRPVQLLNYAVNSFYFVFVWFEGAPLRSLAVDVILDHREGGLILARGEDLVAGRRRKQSLWAPHPATEFRYLLAKKILKKDLPRHQAQRLRNLVREMGRLEAESEAAVLFGDKWKFRVIEACLGASLDTLLPALRKRIWWMTLRRDPLNPLRNFLSDLPRRIRRWFEPTGFFILILGPDGVGKSTLIEHLTRSIGPAFRSCQIFHWRPRMIGLKTETGASAMAPHAEPPRGIPGSVARLLAFFLDYWLGYLLVIRPQIVRSALIVFDRYFQDICVDPLRYRYGGPAWLPRLLAPGVPPPDLFLLVLDADEDVILSRKREVDPEELKRQRAAYVKLATEVTGAHLVKTDSGIEQTVEQVARLVIDRLAQRFGRRHGSWIALVTSTG